MLYVEVDRPFEEIEKSMAAVYPAVKPKHIVTDHTLKNLGFTEQAPCIISLDMTWEEYREMLLDLSDLETFAYIDGEPDPESESYKTYVEHGWLWSMFWCAKDEGKISENPIDSELWPFEKRK